MSNISKKRVKQNQKIKKIEKYKINSFYTFFKKV